MRLACLAVLLTLSAAAAPGQSSAVFPDPNSLAAELQRLKQAGPAGVASLPSAWVVENHGRRYSISTAPLRKIPKAQDQARWLDHLAQQLEGASATDEVPATARVQLDRILARREFTGVGPPSPWERVVQFILGWISEILRKIFDFARQHPTGETILFWLLAAIAAGVPVFWLLRLRVGKRRTAPPPVEQTVPDRSWQQWVVLAREARERGDARAAIHCAYWAGVVRLQDARLLPRDLTHTPREYLRLMPDREISHAPLAALTSALERFWYADRPAGPDDLRESLNHLEALGCSLD
jgi:hypothetical protein